MLYARMPVGRRMSPKAAKMVAKIEASFGSAAAQPVGNDKPTSANLKCIAKQYRRKVPSSLPVPCFSD